MASSSKKPKFYEFFAGGGMARAGLGAGYKCIFANDISQKKAQSYRLNYHPSSEFTLEDIENLDADKLPTGGALAWSSFPCQDISLAGKGRGLKGERSGTFWKFWNLIEGINKKEIIPIIAIENVVGLLSSNKGEDFRILTETLVKSGYKAGAMIIDAQRFLPQSRPRLFIIAVHKSVKIPPELIRPFHDEVFHTDTIFKHYQNFSLEILENWVWWDLPIPRTKVKKLSEIIEDDPVDVSWHTKAETQKLLNSMTDVHRQKIKEALKKKGFTVGAAFRRTRKDENGNKIVRTEVRFDDRAGCLRTPTGGSSRQILIVAENGKVRTRLFSSREAARLMGLSDNYILPEGYNEALHLVGDDVAVPVVSWLEKNIFRIIIANLKSRKSKITANKIG